MVHAFLQKITKFFVESANLVFTVHVQLKLNAGGLTSTMTCIQKYNSSTS